MSNKILKEIIVIVCISIIAGFVYNFFNIRPLPLIRKTDIISDSLFNALTENTNSGVIDTSNKNISANTNIQKIDTAKVPANNAISAKKIDSAKSAIAKASAANSTQESKTMIINYAQTIKLINNPNVAIYDARPQALYAKGHIPNAKNMHPDDFEANIFEFLQMDKNKPLLLYCDGGECDLSHELETKIRPLGFTKIFIFQGGWEEWTKEHSK